jgi:hypothetical protein
MSDERQNKPSASGFERIVLCPGSWKAEWGLPSASSAEAESGTRIHAALAGEVAALSPDEETCRDNCLSLANELIDAYLGDAKEPTRFLKEQRLWTSDEAVSCKADLLAVSGRRAVLIDYKTGRGDVESAEGNYQLMVGAVAAADELDLDSVVVAIIQPWASPQVTQAVYGELELDNAREIIQQALAEANHTNPPLVPGEKQCRYCKARATCPAAKREVESLGMTTLTRNNNEVMAGSDMAAFLAKCSMASSVIAAAKAKAKEMLEQGIEIPGWKLSPGAKRREVTQPDVVFQRTVELGVQASDFMSAVDITIGGLEKLVKKATGLKGTALKEKVDEILTGASEVKQSARSLEKA